ncbi:hypothetical protein ACHQM5_023099 [Ranunculus cassubicifolius]
MPRPSKLPVITFLLLISFLGFVQPLSAAPVHKVSAIFAFGDSTLDPGNNNKIPTILKGNHLPYGRDLPHHPASGRFTNGKLMLDFVVSDLGLKDLLPAYFDANDRELLTGVSFASAGSGFDDMTATISNVVHMNQQLEYFRQALGRIRKTVGFLRAQEIVNNAMFVIGAGTNDMLWNFYDLPTRRGQFTVSTYQDFLLHNLESVVQQLYAMGARKFSIAGLPPIGCLPFQVTVGRSHPPQRVCVEQPNLDSLAYNNKLQAVISGLQARHPGSKIVYADIFSQLADMVHSPGKYGFNKDSTRGCCGSGTLEMGSLCNIREPTCHDASKFIFWDALHPTQATYHVLANNFMTTVLPKF